MQLDNVEGLAPVHQCFGVDEVRTVVIGRVGGGGGDKTIILALESRSWLDDVTRWVDTCDQQSMTGCLSAGMSFHQQERLGKTVS